MEEEKKEFTEEVKEEVVEEVKEETSEETTEQAPVENVQAEVVEEVIDSEPEDEGVQKDLKIDLQTFKEFYNEGGIWAKIKQTLILCAIMVLILYLFRGDEVDWGKFAANCGIYCGIIVLTQIAAQLVMAKLTIPKQYKKMGLESLVITAHFTNKGIAQTIEGREVKIGWNQISYARESEHSFMFYGMNRSGFVFTKDGLAPEEIQYVSSMAKSTVSRYKFEPSKKKK